MYRNLTYDSRNQTVQIDTWDDSGVPITVTCSYEPYLYVETKQKTPYVSLHGTHLERKEFRTVSHRNRYIRETGTRKVFENLRWDQQFLIDRYGEMNEDADFSKHSLRVYFFDIETYSPNGFPVPDQASDTVNVVTIYDTLSNKFITWGLKPLEKPIENCNYIHCETEVELLSKMIDYMEKHPPDILSGWNSEFFDIPYIINRVARVLDEKDVKRLSPVKNVYSRLIQAKFGKEQNKWYVEGLSCIDYLDIYKKFSVGLRESYKLDAIGELELQERKVDFGNTDLSSLADDDWQTFVEYNVQDVNLLVRLEDKLRYLELLRMMAYTGLTTLEGAMGTLQVITGAAVIKARERKKIVPTFVKDSSINAKYEGAYVGEPVRGFQDDVISFDANSLYPNTMISLNLSPETKVGKIIDKNETHVTIKLVNEAVLRISHAKFAEFVNKEQIAISKAKVLFSQKQKGIMPEIVDRVYQGRVEIKKQLNTLKTKMQYLDKSSGEYKQLKKEVDRLDIKQFTLKILINTVYGYFGNKHAPLGDADIARSITLTGQAVIKQSNKILADYVNNICGGDQSYTPVVYNDTDSSYITIARLMKHYGEPFSVNNKVTDKAHQVAQDIEDHLNVEITKWGTRVLNSKDCRFVFKREAMADVGVFIAKKRYVLHVLDDEGFACDKYKYTGVEIVRTTLPAALKPYIKKIVETMMQTKSKQQTNDMFIETYEKFKSLPIEDFAFVMGAKEYDKYADRCDGFTFVKGMPIHIKSSYIYNQLLDKYNLADKYETIGSGDKIRYYYVMQPNRYGIPTMAYKYYLPEEFRETFKPDIEKMFDKIVYSIIERFYEAVDWKLKRPGMQTQTDLFELLGV